MNRIIATIVSSHCSGSCRGLLFCIISSDCSLSRTLLPPCRSCMFVSSSSRSGFVVIVSFSSYSVCITVFGIFSDRKNRCCTRLFLVVVRIVSFSSFRIVSIGIPSSRCCGSKIIFLDSSNNTWDRLFLASLRFRCDRLLFVLSKGRSHGPTRLQYSKWLMCLLFLVVLSYSGSRLVSYHPMVVSIISPSRRLE